MPFLVISGAPLVLYFLPKLFSVSLLRWINLLMSLSSLLVTTKLLLSYGYNNYDLIIS